MKKDIHEYRLNQDLQDLRIWRIPAVRVRRGNRPDCRQKNEIEDGVWTR